MEKWEQILKCQSTLKDPWRLTSCKILYVYVKASPSAAKIVFALIIFIVYEHLSITPMVKSMLCLLQRSHVRWKHTNRVKVWDQWQVFFCFFLFFFFFRWRLNNLRRFPYFQLPTIGVTADIYILHFLDNRRCSYTIHFVQRKHNVPWLGWWAFN
jgi:hypothetical protein